MKTTEYTSYIDTMTEEELEAWIEEGCDRAEYEASGYECF